MKRTLYIIFAVLAVCSSFTACDDDDDFSVDRGTHSTLPETIIAGTYTGSYDVYNADGETLENTYPATVDIAAGENKNTITLTSTCSGANELNGAEQYPLNVTWANDDIKFWGLTTPSSTSGYLNSANLNGTLSNGELTFRFSKTVRSGRLTVTKFYNFKGTK